MTTGLRRGQVRLSVHQLDHPDAPRCDCGGRHCWHWLQWRAYMAQRPDIAHGTPATAEACEWLGFDPYTGEAVV